MTSFRGFLLSPIPHRGIVTGYYYISSGARLSVRLSVCRRTLFPIDNLNNVVHGISFTFFIHIFSDLSKPVGSD